MNWFNVIQLVYHCRQHIKLICAQQYQAHVEYRDGRSIILHSDARIIPVPHTPVMELQASTALPVQLNQFVLQIHKKLVQDLAALEREWRIDRVLEMKSMSR